METILEWKAPEHHYEKRTTDWYWIFGAIIVASAFLSFYFHNPILGVLILVAGLTIGTLSHKDTKIVSIKIVPEGIIVHRSLSLFSSYRSFWIQEDHVTGSRILLHPLRSYLPLVAIPVAEDVDLEHLREVMMEFLDEEYLEESFIHKMFDSIGL